MLETLEISAATTHDFPLLTNHAYALALIAHKPDIRMREIASTVRITERAVQRIVDDLTVAGYVVITKSGRRNQYVIQKDHLLHQPLMNHQTIAELVRFLYPDS